MAEFLSKEQVNLQSIGQFQPSTVAKDFSTLFSVIGQTGKVIQESMIKESDIAGSLLARDRLVQLVKKQEESERRRSEMGDDQFDFEAEKQDFGLEVANSLNEARKKFGEDSRAYKTFEDMYLLQATKTTENYKTVLEKANETWANNKLIEGTNTQLQATVNKAGEKTINSYYKSFSVAGVADDKISKLTTDTFVGKFVNSAFDAKSVYNADGTLNKEKYKRAFETFFDSVASMDKEGNVTSKHSWIQQNDLDDLKKQWDAFLNGEATKSQYNRAFQNAKLKIEREKDLINFGSSQDVANFISSSESELDTALYSTIKAKEEDITSRNKIVNDLQIIKNKYTVAENILSKAEQNVGTILKTGFYGDIAVDKNTLEKVATNKLDAEFGSVIKKAKSYEERVSLLIALKQKEQVYGVSSKVMSEYVGTIKNLYVTTSTDPVAEISDNIQMAKAIVASGYTDLSSLGMNKELLKDYEGILTTSQMKNLDGDEVKKLLAQAKLSYNGTKETVDLRIAQNNNMAFGKLTDDNLQSALTDIFQGVYTTNINMDNHIGGFSTAFQGLAMQMAEDGTQLDTARPMDEGNNFEMLKSTMASRMYVSDYDAFNATAFLLPDIKAPNGVKRPLSGENFMKGLVQVAKEKFKASGWKQPSLNLEDNIQYETSYMRGQGWQTRIRVRKDNTSPYITLGVYTGNDLYDASARNKDEWKKLQSEVTEQSFNETDYLD